MGTGVENEPVDPSDELAFYCLGGGNEVGRSCHIIQYKGKTVMVRPRNEIFHNCQLNTLIFSSTRVCIQQRKGSLRFHFSMSLI